MACIIRGTTPTIKYTFRTIKTSDITVAYLTIKSGEVTVEKDLTYAIVEDGALSWTLSQEETLSLSGKATFRVNYKTEAGLRGASVQTLITIEDNEKAEVI